jgi:hypothetical protein
MLTPFFLSYFFYFFIKNCYLVFLYRVLLTNSDGNVLPPSEFPVYIFIHVYFLMPGPRTATCCATFDTCFSYMAQLRSSLHGVGSSQNISPWNSVDHLPTPPVLPWVPNSDPSSIRSSVDASSLHVMKRFQANTDDQTKKKGRWTVHKWWMLVSNTIVSRSCVERKLIYYYRRLSKMDPLVFCTKKKKKNSSLSTVWVVCY